MAVNKRLLKMLFLFYKNQQSIPNPGMIIAINIGYRILLRNNRLVYFKKNDLKTFDIMNIIIRRNQCKKKRIYYWY